MPPLSKRVVRTISTLARVCNLRSLEPVGGLEVACPLSVCLRLPEMLSSDFKFPLFPGVNSLLQGVCHLVRPTRLSRIEQRAGVLNDCGDVVLGQMHGDQRPEDDPQKGVSCCQTAHLVKCCPAECAGFIGPACTPGQPGLIAFGQGNVIATLNRHGGCHALPRASAHARHSPACTPQPSNTSEIALAVACCPS